MTESDSDLENRLGEGRTWIQLEKPELSKLVGKVKNALNVRYGATRDQRYADVLETFKRLELDIGNSHFDLTRGRASPDSESIFSTQEAYKVNLTRYEKYTSDVVNWLKQNRIALS